MPDSFDWPIDVHSLDAYLHSEKATRPARWAVLATSDLGDESVHGIFKDPLKALCAAEYLAQELVRPLGNTGYTDPAEWRVRLVPYYPAERPPQL